MDRESQDLDVVTLNAVMKVLSEELAKYPPDSQAALALWKFKERLSG